MPTPDENHLAALRRAGVKGLGKTVDTVISTADAKRMRSHPIAKAYQARKTTPPSLLAAPKPADTGVSNIINKTRDRMNREKQVLQRPWNDMEGLDKPKYPLTYEYVKEQEHKGEFYVRC